MLFFRPLCFVALGVGLASALEAEHPHKYDRAGEEKLSPEATFYKPSLAPYLGHSGGGSGSGGILDHGIAAPIMEHAGALGHVGNVGPLYGGVADHSGLGDLGYNTGYGLGDDYHKYGGIGKKTKMSQLYDHGSKGYKNYYGDTGYGNTGLNKYSGSHSSDHYGGKSGMHSNYNNGHVYTRNRGYGYEKHYMYDKEYSTSNKHGTKNGNNQYYGDHDKGQKYGMDMHKKYGHKKYGNKAGHMDHSYGKFDHLLDKHGEHLMKLKNISPTPDAYIETTGVEHIPIVQNDAGYHSEYVPVGDTYSGALNHGTPIIEAHSAHGLGGIGSGGDSYSGFEPQSQYSSDSGVVYMPSKESSEPSKTAVAPSSSPLSSSSPSSSHDSGKTLEGYSRIASAVHATPAVISTATGAHYYASS